jgi:nucleoid-associated protein EbfC
VKSIEEMMQAAQEAATRIQEQMGAAQSKLDEIDVEGVSGGGLVKVTATQRAG